MKPKGKKPKFIKPADKHNANEGQYRVFQQDLTLKQGSNPAGPPQNVFFGLP